VPTKTLVIESTRHRRARNWRPFAWFTFICLLILGAIIRIQQVEAQAFLGTPPLSSASVANSGGGQVCGNEAPPSQAVTAGFTTCAVNFDFTQSTGASWMPSKYAFGGPIATLSNWLDCTGTSTSTNVAWRWANGFQGHVTPTCNTSAVSQVTDAAGGGNLALDLHYNSSWPRTVTGCTTAGNSCSANMDTIQSNCDWNPWPGFTGNCANALTIPPAFYAEVVYRMDAPNNSGPSSPILGPAIWNYQYINGACPMEFDVGELYWGNRNSNGGAGDIGAPNYTGSECARSSSAGFVWHSPEAFGPFPQPSAWSSNTYQTHGMLVTNNGGSANQDAIVCGYIGTGAENASTFSWCAWDFPAAGQTTNNRQFLIMNGGLYGSSSPTVPSYDTYVQYYRVWSCASWATGQCNGSTYVGDGSNDGTLQYWH
jgi:hypothetical protein